MRLIDADALTRKIQSLIRIRQRNIFDALDEIDSAPTINPADNWIPVEKGMRMNTHDATEQAYRNGYEVGYNKGWISGCEQAMKGIVLCKDCKHYSPDNKKGLLHNPCSRIFAMSICEEDSFCSYGERKEEKHD